MGRRYTPQERYQRKRSLSRKLAPILLANKIKAINSTRTKIYYGVFFLQAYMKFKAQTKLPLNSLALLMVVDFYQMFMIGNAEYWFLYEDKVWIYRNMKFLIKEGYVHRDKGTRRYVITLLGKKLLEDFFVFYRHGANRLNRKNYERLSKQSAIRGYSSPKTKKSSGQDNRGESGSTGTDSNGL